MRVLRTRIDRHLTDHAARGERIVADLDDGERCAAIATSIFRRPVASQAAP